MLFIIRRFAVKGDAMRNGCGLKHVLAITLLCTQANALSADSSVDVDVDILLVGGAIIAVTASHLPWEA